MTLYIAGAAILGVFVAGKALGWCSVCKDGWLSGSSGRGTCSWHGGVDD